MPAFATRNAAFEAAPERPSIIPPPDHGSNHRPRDMGQQHADQGTTGAAHWDIEISQGSALSVAARTGRSESSKQGEACIRVLFVFGAKAVLRYTRVGNNRRLVEADARRQTEDRRGGSGEQNGVDGMGASHARRGLTSAKSRIGASVRHGGRSLRRLCLVLRRDDEPVAAGHRQNLRRMIEHYDFDGTR